MRKIFILVIVSVLLIISSPVGGDELLDLKDGLKKQQELTQKLLKRVEELEEKLAEREVTGKEDTGEELVILEEESIDPYKEESFAKRFLDKRWFERFDIGGVASARYMNSQDKGFNPEGGFQLWEARPFIEADIWHNISFFFEADLVKDAKQGTGTELGSGEVYFNFRNLLRRWGWEKALNVKVGRMDIPFGEEYLWNDSFDNPLIFHSANWPYGYDEGILLYGSIGPVSYISSVMDGDNSKEGPDDTSDKAFSFKLYGKPLESLYLSGSFMRTGTLGDNDIPGKRGKSAIEFANSHIIPLGSNFLNKVKADLYELDARYIFGPAYLDLAFGQVFIRNSSWDRDLDYFRVESLYNFTEKFYGIARFSGIGTFDDKEGYEFEADNKGDGFRSDTKAVTRLSFGLGYRLNPHVILKFEYSLDDFKLVDTSLLGERGDKRNFFGFEVAIKY